MTESLTAAFLSVVCGAALPVQGDLRLRLLGKSFADGILREIAGKLPGQVCKGQHDLELIGWTSQIWDKRNAELNTGTAKPASFVR